MSRTSFDEYLGRYGQHMTERVCITHPGDFPKGFSLEEALQRFDSEDEKICWCQWPRAQVGGFVTYPKSDEGPSETKLHSTFLTLFASQYYDNWNQ